MQNNKQTFFKIFSEFCHCDHFGYKIQDFMKQVISDETSHVADIMVFLVTKNSITVRQSMIAYNFIKGKENSKKVPDGI